MLAMYFTPQELRDMYVEKYAQAFECDLEHAYAMFISEYSDDHDFHEVRNIIAAIESMERLCGI